MSSLDAPNIDLGEAFFEVILNGLPIKITKHKLKVGSQNGQLFIPHPLIANTLL